MRRKLAGSGALLGEGWSGAPVAPRATGNALRTCDSRGATMVQEAFILDCPACGEVAGYNGNRPGDELDAGPAEGVIEVDELEARHGMAAKVRCPECGRWMAPDRVRPA